MSLLLQRASLLSTSIVTLEIPGILDDEVETWRILATQSNATNVVTFGEIELLTSPGGSDLTSPALQSFSDFVTSGSAAFGGTATQLFDTNTTTFWAGEVNGIALGTSYIDVAFSTPRLVAGVEITARATVNGDQAPRGFDFLGSADGISFSPILTATGEIGFGAGEEREYISLAPQVVSFVRLLFTEAGSYDGAAISGLKILRESSGQCQVLEDFRRRNRISSGGALNADSFPANAFDDTPGTQWQSGDELVSNNNSWIGYDFDTPQSITNINLTTGSFGSQAPLAFILQRRQIGSQIWEDMLTVTGESPWTNGETRSF